MNCTQEKRERERCLDPVGWKTPQGKKNIIIKKLLRPVPSQSMVEQAKKHSGFRPQRGYPGNALRLQRARWLRIT